MEKIYYIDSENVGDSWIELLDELTQLDSRLIVFYTKHSPRMTYQQTIQLMNSANKPEFIECHEGSNALDFQLVSYLGYELCADRTKEMIIVSKDTGFDAVVHFWQERGMQVKRVPTPNQLHVQRTTPKTAFPAVPTPIAASTGEVSGQTRAAQPHSRKKASKQAHSAHADRTEIAGSDTLRFEQTVVAGESLCDLGLSSDELCTVINCIGKKHLETIHNALVGFLGDKEGTNLYLELKADKFSVPALQWDRETRLESFIAMILTRSGIAEEEHPASIAAYMANNVVDKKGVMAGKLRSAYGAAWGARFHETFKPFYKVLTEIKQQ